MIASRFIGYRIGPRRPGKSAKAQRMATSPVSGKDQFLRRKSADEYIRQKFGFGGNNFLAKSAHSGDSPPFYKPTARVALYRVSDIDDWVLTRLGAPRRSTSEQSEK
jgi:hypothetical protein